MKKKHIVLTAAVLCGVFLICQFLLHHSVFTSVSTLTYVDQRYSIDRLQLSVMHLKTYELVLFIF